MAFLISILPYAKLKCVFSPKNKTSVESVKLERTFRIEYKSESGLKLEIFHSIIHRVQGGTKNLFKKVCLLICIPIPKQRRCIRGKNDRFIQLF